MFPHQNVAPRNPQPLGLCQILLLSRRFALRTPRSHVDALNAITPAPVVGQSSDLPCPCARGGLDALSLEAF